MRQVLACVSRDAARRSWLALVAAVLESWPALFVAQRGGSPVADLDSYAKIMSVSVPTSTMRLDVVRQPWPAPLVAQSGNTGLPPVGAQPGKPRRAPAWHWSGLSPAAVAWHRSGSSPAAPACAGRGAAAATSAEAE